MDLSFHERFAEVYVDIVDQPMGDYVDIRLKRYINGVKHLANFVKGARGITVISWEQVQEGQEIPEHLNLRLSRDVARFLFDGFKRVLKDEDDRKDLEDGRFDAMRRHLMDMRALAFNALKVKDPMSPIYVDFDKINPEAADMVAEITGRTIIDKEYEPKD